MQGLREPEQAMTGCRLMGRAVFCQELLEQHGSVVFVPVRLVHGSCEQLAKYLKPGLEAAGGTLSAYKQ